MCCQTDVSACRNYFSHIQNRYQMIGQSHRGNGSLKQRCWDFLLWWLQGRHLPKKAKWKCGCAALVRRCVNTFFFFFFFCLFVWFVWFVLFGLFVCLLFFFDLFFLFGLFIFCFTCLQIKAHPSELPQLLGPNGTLRNQTKK